MRVSIIVPVYNVEKYVQSCIKSILAQDFNDIELIIVDDCSPDKSIALAKEILADSRITAKIVVHDKNRGLSAARNSGIKAATGEVLYFIDSDDELSDKTAISSLVAELEETNADIVAGNYQRVYKDKVIVSKRYCQRAVIHCNNIISAFCRGDIPIIACNKLIRTEFIQKNGLYFKEGIIHEDELWSFQCIMVANIIVLTGKTTYNYYQQEGSIMNEKLHRRLESSIEIYDEMAKCYKQQIKVCNRNLATHLNRFAFQRYREIMGIDDNNIKKALYRKLRQCQLAIRIYKSIKEQCMHAHLLLPSFIGFYTMSLTMHIYNIILSLKQR